MVKVRKLAALFGIVIIFILFAAGLATAGPAKAPTETLVAVTPTPSPSNKPVPTTETTIPLTEPTTVVVTPTILPQPGIAPALTLPFTVAPAAADVFTIDVSPKLAKGVPASTGSISGTVINTVSGEVISGATVSIAGFNATSGGDGTYIIVGVSVDNHDLTASRSGFRTRTVNSFPVREGANVQNIALTPDSVDTGGIYGYVVNAINGARLSGAKLQLADGLVRHSDGS
ncbi:MAG: carboxypeptidase regulatory-like domain-containing protein, partial [Chloroflexi bacterium]|nr:carboxypeptidase regulatory-like domain-containing protein [Chloroflexota bacterium]